MQIRVSRDAWQDAVANWMIVPVCESGEADSRIAALDTALGGQLTRLREAGDLTGGADEIVELRDVPQVAAQRVLLVGLGPREKVDSTRWSRAVMTAARRLSERPTQHAAVGLPELDPLSSEKLIQLATTAMTVGCEGQGLYRREPARFPFETITLLTGNGDPAENSERAAESGRILGEAINLTRELVNRTADDIYPASFAERAKTLAEQSGMMCDILDETRLQNERMGSLLAVARGSDRPPRLVVLEYRGGGDGPTLALCGKGVTFDSGGLSLKSNDNMKTMKCDMAGAATVCGAMTAIARLKLPVNVTGYMGLVENMPSGRAFKLGDVLTARNGTTIEVLNTDAEGRLVLADVLSYAVDRGAGKVIDLATLTGACVVALGDDVTGAFANDQVWCETILAAAREAGEDVWQLPMFDHFTELLKSEVADIKNVGDRAGGAITAAKFLEHFVGSTPWVHLDIAGPAFAPSSKPHRDGGATGCMVRTLVATAQNFG